MVNYSWLWLLMVSVGYRWLTTSNNYSVILVWVRQCHKPTMTGNGKHTTYEKCWWQGDGFWHCFTQIICFRSTNWLLEFLENRNRNMPMFSSFGRVSKVGNRNFELSWNATMHLCGTSELHPQVSGDGNPEALPPGNSRYRILEKGHGNNR